MKSPTYIAGTGRNWRRIGAVVVAIMLGLYLIFEFGRIQAGYNIIDAAEDRQAFGHQVDVLEDEISALKQEVALLETHREIDAEAYAVVESSLTDLQRKIQEQQDAIAFYRGIVSPKDGGRGLKVQDLRLTKTDDEGRYHVRLVLVQVMQHDRSVKGVVDFSLEGDQDGEAKTYKLSELTPDNADSTWAFSFRYFQDFDRELKLPEGFRPERVNIEVVSRTKSIDSIKQSYVWQSAQS